MLAQSKSILAKLLATENITVEHRKISTAYFDTKNRVMALPIWKDMSPELYDLLLGHETGHALFTPDEGWHDNLKDKTQKGFKTYLNVIEDVRIEKRVQEKYPGLKISFKKGYSELMAKDFFGVVKHELTIPTLPLIDRINLHYKVGSYLNIQFNCEEQYYIDQIDTIKTWEDVVRISKELYQYAKDEASSLRDTGDLMVRVRADNEDEDEDFDDFDDLEEMDIEDPESITDRNFREREHELVDDSVKPYIYVNCPTPNLRKIIVPYKNIKKFYNRFNQHYHSEMTPDEFDAAVQESKTKLFNRFNNTNKKYISYLIKEFELRRNARQFARTSVSKTGELDMKKIHQYKLNDDLFKRMAVVPKGKSHGLVMFIDYSGSMVGNIKATIEQTIVLATFCRKVNVPFRVYAFTNSSMSIETEIEEFGTIVRKDFVSNMDSDYVQSFKFSQNNNELSFRGNSFRLREYLSSEMSSLEFKEAIKYWLLVGEIFSGRSWRTNANSDVHPDIKGSDFEDLSGTPLNEAIISSMEIVKEFRKQYKLDVVNTVFLTDGDSDESRYVNGGSNVPNPKYQGYNLIIRDAKTMNEGKSPPGCEMTVALLELLRANTGVNVIGFFISAGNHKRNILIRLDKTGKVINNLDESLRVFRKEKFFMINDVGYDDFYIIPGGEELSIEDEEMKVESGASTANLKKAFMNMQKGKSINRVLLNRFVGKIA